MDFENNLKIGSGVYTPAEIARILRLPNYKVNRWINKYWDGDLGKDFEGKYSWVVDNSKAVSFHTMVEFYVMIQFAEAGVKTRNVLQAHKQLTNLYKTVFPFAQKEILYGIKTDGRNIYLNTKSGLITLDGSMQLNLDFLKLFFKKLDFNSEQIATRLWPIGKKKSIVCDPEIQFGYPTIEGTRIYPDTIYEMYKYGESKKFIASSYDLTTKQVNHAIEYCKEAA